MLSFVWCFRSPDNRVAVAKVSSLSLAMVVIIAGDNLDVATQGPRSGRTYVKPKKQRGVDSANHHATAPPRRHPQLASKYLHLDPPPATSLGLVRHSTTISALARQDGRGTHILPV